MVKALEGGGLTPCVSTNFGGRELVSGYELKYLPGLHRLLVKSAHRQINERACSPPAPNSYLAALPFGCGVPAVPLSGSDAPQSNGRYGERRPKKHPEGYSERLTRQEGL
jgi:hypothetical protein